ncbi:phage tail protein [Dokdonella sp.]|uniref:phage tail protein n=1 Tax=Dokdonella sp. TaxID=2291710 RepID=UPI0025C1C720|nr:phage tail protein [Dokdonella sp.]
MGLEAATYISDLSASNPVASDLQSQGDDHLRLIKAVLQTTFPNASRAFRMQSVVAVTAGDITVVAPTDDTKVFPVNATAAARTVTMPSSSLFSGYSNVVVKTDSSANAVTVAAAALINGAASIKLYNQYDAAILWYSSADTTWYAFIVTRSWIPPASASGNVTLDNTYQDKLLTVSASGASRTITLPSTLPAGFKCKVKKTDSTANTVTLDATSGGSINGANTVVLRFQYEEVEIVFDGTTWHAPVYDPFPPGSSMLWWTDTAPTGWVFLEGQAISRTTYPRLFALFSTTFGVGDGSTTFNLPDVRGRFPRFWDHGKGLDPDAATRTAPAGSSVTAGDHVATLQDDQFEAHTHSYDRSAPNAINAGQGSGFAGNGAASTASGSAGSGTETRPTNMNVGVIIKLG